MGRDGDKSTKLLSREDTVGEENLLAQAKNKNKQACCYWITAAGGTTCSAATVIYALTAATVAVMAAAVVTRSSSYYYYGKNVPSIRVAFVGNSISFVNDLPRFMERLSESKIAHQDSCLHGSLSLKSFLTRGNGMYNKWQTDNALMDTMQVAVDADDDDDATEYESVPVYDFGACSVPQLLLGYDSALTSSSSGDDDDDDSYNYSDDGKNPCLVDPNYLEYLNQRQHHTALPTWDYVVLNDQTIYPGIVSRRQKSLKSFENSYADLFQQAASGGGAVRPVLLATYGYEKADNGDDDDNQDDDEDDESKNLGDVAEFTSRVWYGYNAYYELLSSLLPRQQKPLLVPVGLAFLMVYEENYDMWLQLFYDDGYHPSPHGTYLIGCCLYATLFNRMPRKTSSSSKKDDSDDTTVEELFATARLMHTDAMGDDKDFPTTQEAEYLLKIAERVVLKRQQPATLLPLETVAAIEAAEEEEENNGNDGG